MKQVPDPEGPADAFEVSTEEMKVIPVGIPPVINPFDENALEVAIRLKESNNAKILGISLGDKLSQPVLKKGLAVGVDDLILLEDPQFKDLDSFSTAYLLSCLILKIGAYDLIFTGRQAGDWDFGITGVLLAEMLNIPCINIARKVEIKDSKILVEKMTRDGYEVVTTSMPALVTLSGEAGELRYASVLSLKSVRSTPVKVYHAGDVEIDPQRLQTRPVNKLYSERVQRECKFIDGESPQERGEKLVIKLKEEGVI
jgi:electron transfer flavoprotein beta subunit